MITYLPGILLALLAANVLLRLHVGRRHVPHKWEPCNERECGCEGFCKACGVGYNPVVEQQSCDQTFERLEFDRCAWRHEWVADKLRREREGDMQLVPITHTDRSSILLGAQILCGYQPQMTVKQRYTYGNELFNLLYRIQQQDI